MKSLIQPARFFRATAFAALFVAASIVAFAKETALTYNFLVVGSPDPVTLLAPPPLPGTAEQFTDMEAVHAVYHYASDADKQAAYDEKKFSVFNFTPVVGAFFNATNLPKTAAFFAKVHDDADALTEVGKEYFRRPRPFQTETNLANGAKLEASFSYPSGHSTEAMTLALVLSELLPEKSDAILAHGRLMGWHRVQIARHYPTDIYAGRVLAQAIVKQMKKNADFEESFAAVKKEIEAAQK